MTKDLHSNTDLLVRAWFRQHIRSVIWVGLLTALISLIILPSPFLTSELIDVCLPQRDVGRLFWVVGLILLLMLLQSGLSYILNMAHNRLNEGLILDLKETLLARIHGAPLATTQKLGRGSLLSLIDQDTAYVRTFLADSLFALGKDLLTFIVGLIALLTIQPRFALAALLALPFFAWFSQRFSRQTRRCSDEYLEARSGAVNALQESLDGVATCKAFPHSPYRTWSFRSLSDRARESFLVLMRTQEQANLTLGLIAGLAPILVISYGTYLVIQEQLSLGKLMAFNQFVGYLFGPTQRLLGLRMAWSRARAATNRLDRILGLTQEEDPVSAAPIESLRLEAMSYAIDGTVLLQDVNLTLRRGMCLGINGPSGSGKTTLGHLLCGLIPATEGRFVLNGNPLDLASDYVRSRARCALLDQNPFFLNLTIQENVAFEEVIDVGRVRRCLEQAGAWSFVVAKDEGLQTQIGVGGNRLSAGQRQRLALARALYREPDLLVLDEPTSNLDPENTRKFIDLLPQLTKNRIVCVISHDAAVVASCTHQIRVESGLVFSSSKLLTSENGSSNQDLQL